MPDEGMKITSRELGEQLQVLSGGSPTQAAQQLDGFGNLSGSIR